MKIGKSVIAVFIIILLSSNCLIVLIKIIYSIIKILGDKGSYTRRNKFGWRNDALC